MKKQILHFLSKSVQTVHQSISGSERSKYSLRLGGGMLLLCAVTAQADYRQIVEETFWEKVYPTGGQTFYCNTEFSSSSPVLNVGHIYPTNWISEFLGCRSERTCLRTKPEYEVMISDMHNMIPVNAYQYLKLKGSVFGNLDDSIDTNECGIRKRFHLIDPPKELKGDIARIHFYMHQKYQLPLNSNYAFMKEWHRQDPPSPEEKAKNQRINDAQGNDNPFVSNPKLVDDLEL